MLALLALPATACSGIGSSSPATVSTSAVQRFVAVKEATDNTSRLISLIAAANLTSSEVSRMRTQTPAETRLLNGAKIGWNNVLVGVNAFTPLQAAAVPGLMDMITTVRRTAINWSNGLGALNSGHPRPAGPAIAKLTRQAGMMKSPIEKAVAALARTACTLEKANSGFVTPAAAKADCAGADQLQGSS